MAAPAQSAPDPRARTRLGRLLQGFTYPFRAVGLMFRYPRLWTYALVPILITLVLLSVLFVVLVYQAGHLTGLIWHRPAAWYAEIPWYLLYGLVFAGTFVVGALTLPSILSVPFNSALCGRVEAILAGDREVARPSKTMLRKLAFDQLGLVLALPVGHAILLLLLLIPAAGPVIYPVLATLWTMLWSAVNYLDYPMGRHGYRFRAERKVVRHNLGLGLGFGAGVYLILIVPVVDLLFIPVAIVGATLLYADLARAEALPPTPRG